MTETHISGARSGLPWGAILGFGALALMWPVLHLFGVPDLIGALATSLGTLAVTAVVWVLGAGFGNVPRPVASLALAGVVYGVVVTLTASLLGVWADFGPGVVVAAVLVEVGRAAGLGALAGLLAGAIQRARR